MVVIFIQRTNKSLIIEEFRGSCANKSLIIEEFRGSKGNDFDTAHERELDY